ncbi:S-adenosyl-L-methionine-dependent methyltransferase [Phycomyces blakesleeanus]|uniref:Protein arginine methyltransferase NDUFAF7 n=2 Tax=Phycomyces blakesleeanus TaxID=4837 RepID=A0ABR3AIG4_PHYBL
MPFLQRFTNGQPSFIRFSHHKSIKVIRLGYNQYCRQPHSAARCLTTKSSKSFTRTHPSAQNQHEHHQQRPGFFTPFFSRHNDKEHAKFIRSTANDASSLPNEPTRTKMLVRDFIDNSLHHPNYGYFSKQAALFSPEVNFDFLSMRDHREFMNILGKMYIRMENEPDEVNGIRSRQVWHSPTELFKPWYGHAIAKYMVSEYKLNLYPHKDLIIYEIGAGNGTLMMNILDYIKEHEPSVYKRTQYNIIETSTKLAQIQSERQDIQEAKDKHACVKISNKSIFDWDTYVPEQCFFLGMEVIDNFAHDLIRYDLETMEPFQALVSIDDQGDYTEMYEPVGNDPVIAQYLGMRKQTHYRSPVLSSRVWHRFLGSLPIAPNMTAPEYIPTKLFLFLDILKQYFPHHRLVLSDFASVPDPIEGVDGPAVQTKYRGSTVPCSTYLVQPGWFDIFFPTNFELLREIYLLVCRGSRAGNQKSVRILTHRNFCERYGEIEMTTTRSGENPMLMYHRNMKMLLT